MNMKKTLKDVVHLYLGSEMNILREDGHTVDKVTINPSKLVLLENDYYGGSEKLMFTAQVPMSTYKNVPKKDLIVVISKTSINRMTKIPKSIKIIIASTQNK